MNWLYRCEEGYTHEKSNCPVSKYFHAFVSTLNYVSPIGAVTKEDEVVMRDRIDNFRPVWQQTIRSESTQDNAETLPPASRDYVILFVIFLKTLKPFFLHQLNSKNNGPVLRFKTIVWYWYRFPSSVAMDWNLGQQQETWHTATRWVHDRFRYVRWRRRWLWSSL